MTSVIPEEEEELYAHVLLKDVQGVWSLFAGSQLKVEVTRIVGMQNKLLCLVTHSIKQNILWRQRAGVQRET